MVRLMYPDGSWWQTISVIQLRATEDPPNRTGLIFSPLRCRLRCPRPSRTLRTARLRSLAGGIRNIERTGRGKTVHSARPPMLATACSRPMMPRSRPSRVALDAPPPQRARDDDLAVGPDSVIVLDFGGQTAQLIARRVREINVYSSVPIRHAVGGDPQTRARAPSFSPAVRSASTKRARHIPDQRIWQDSGLPVLGTAMGSTDGLSPGWRRHSGRRSANTARRSSRSRLRTVCSRALPASSPYG